MTKKVKNQTKVSSRHQVTIPAGAFRTAAWSPATLWRSKLMEPAASSSLGSKCWSIPTPGASRPVAVCVIWPEVSGRSGGSPRFRRCVGFLDRSARTSRRGSCSRVLRAADLRRLLRLPRLTRTLIWSWPAISESRGYPDSAARSACWAEVSANAWVTALARNLGPEIGPRLHRTRL